MLGKTVCIQCDYMWGFFLKCVSIIVDFTPRFCWFDWNRSKSRTQPSDLEPESLSAPKLLSACCKLGVSNRPPGFAS